LTFILSPVRWYGVCVRRHNTREENIVEAIKSFFRRDKSVTPRFLKDTTPDQKLWNEILRDKYADQ